MVVGSPDERIYHEATKDVADPYWRRVDAVRATAARCGFAILTEQGGRFTGFRHDRMAFVAGGFATRALADAALPRLRPCFADAHVKRGRYIVH